MDFLPGTSNWSPLEEIGRRVHAPHLPAGPSAEIGFNESVTDVLHSRKAIQGSPFAEHITYLRNQFYGLTSMASGVPAWNYSPATILKIFRENPESFGEDFKERTREVSETIEVGCRLLRDIQKIRACSATRESGGGQSVWPVEITGEDGLVRAVIAQARSGANRNRSTKSNLVTCPHPSWQELTSEFGLRGPASYPAFGTGAWSGGLLTGEYADWRQDYMTVLIYGFYFEYNIDAVGGSARSNLMRDFCCMLDMPDLPADLQARRAHMMGDMAFFELKRSHEADLRSVPTTGMTAWVFADRDSWRDFKACDSGIFGYYLSVVPGDVGRTDLMVSGLVNDWVDLGPDLRNGECAQSVLTMTRGSISTESLLECYERSLWMINHMLTPEGGIKPERFSMLSMCMAVCIWNSGDHRHDVWRYYALAAESCTLVQKRDVYRACRIQDCYSTTLVPITPQNTDRITVPRRPLRYSVRISGKKHEGEIEIHAAVVQGIEAGLLPKETVEYQYIIPRLLAVGAITSVEFLEYMDHHYCENAAKVIRAAHESNFSTQFANALSSLVLEQWWSGIMCAMGIGSLIEAQPGNLAHDRIHHVDGLSMEEHGARPTGPASC
ncbi:hypothetical protein ACWFRJ_43625 [Streptomyces sp. NPDC055239]